MEEQQRRSVARTSFAIKNFDAFDLDRTVVNGSARVFHREILFFVTLGGIPCTRTIESIIIFGLLVVLVG
jgi:hypothetical protein